MLKQYPNKEGELLKKQKGRQEDHAVTNKCGNSVVAFSWNAAKVLFTGAKANDCCQGISRIF
jgi:hypothetical protein